VKLSIIIPCYNEKNTICSLIDAVKEAPVANKEIIVVDDGSKDGTREVLETLRSQDIKIIYHQTNQGKGAEDWLCCGNR